MSIKTIVVAATIILALGAAGCTTLRNLPDLQTGVANEADATAIGGKPSYVWKNADGTRTLEYSDQPYNGESAYMVTVDANGKVSKVQPIVVNAESTRVTTGMTHDEVRRLLGTPRTIVNYALSGEEVWDWNIPFMAGMDSRKRLNVHFKQGKVVRTSGSQVFDCTRYTLLAC